MYCCGSLHLPHQGKTLQFKRKTQGYQHVYWRSTLCGHELQMSGECMPPPLEDPQIRTWTHIHMSSSHLLMNGTPQSLTMILHTLMDWTPVKSLTNPLVTPCLMLVVISISTSLPTSTPSWMHLQEIVGHTQKSLLFSQPISIRVHPKSLTGMLYAHFFAWTSPSSIKDTFNVTTRHGTAPHIQDYQSEPYHQHQNKAENHFGLAKLYTNTVMNTSGCPACFWLLCLQYICVVLDHLASPTLRGICPVQALEGTTPDISFMLHFSFYEPVYYRIDSSEPDLHFPSLSNENKGYWVSFSDNPGDHLT